MQILFIQPLLVLPTTRFEVFFFFAFLPHPLHLLFYLTPCPSPKGEGSLIVECFTLFDYLIFTFQFILPPSPLPWGEGKGLHAGQG
jgi:hypothetical protein